jgi:hypothetical protein
LQALYLITQGARAAAFRNVKTIAECLVRPPSHASRLGNSCARFFDRTGKVVIVLPIDGKSCDCFADYVI